MEKIWVLDTTLRDGIQAPGCYVTTKQKLELARYLEETGVDIVEVGFPASSKMEYESIKEIGKNLEKCSVAALSRSLIKDIKVTAEALSYAKNPFLHLSLATSPIHRKYKLGLSQNEVLKKVRDMTLFASGYCSEIEFGAEDATRTEPEFLIEVYATAIEAGAKVVNMADTLGIASPNQIQKLTKKILQALPMLTSTHRLSIHCHNDMGFALVNSQAALLQGASQVEVTLSGVGERAGNTTLESIYVLDLRGMLIKNQNNQKRVTRLNIKDIYSLRKKARILLKRPISPLLPHVGQNTYQHSSGLHLDGLSKHHLTYHVPSIPEIQPICVLGPLSGTRGFCQYLMDRGIGEYGRQIKQRAGAPLKRLYQLSNEEKGDLFIKLRGYLKDSSLYGYTDILNFLAIQKVLLPPYYSQIGNKALSSKKIKKTTTIKTSQAILSVQYICADRKKELKILESDCASFTLLYQAFKTIIPFQFKDMDLEIFSYSEKSLEKHTVQGTVKVGGKYLSAQRHGVNKGQTLIALILDFINMYNHQFKIK